MKVLRINLPLNEKIVAEMKAGDRIFLTGVIYTARDAAHKRLCEALLRGEKLPIDVKDQVIYYSGPTPAKPGNIVGSIGPTTSGRMDVYTPQLLDAGLKGMIGKGHRSQAVKEAMVKYKAVYLAAAGGAGALLSKTVKKSKVVAYKDLGTEAIHMLEVEDFPAIVVNDIYGGDLYQQGKSRYQIKTSPS